MLCRNGIIPYLQITTKKEKDGALDIREPKITIGCTACSWRYRTARDELDKYSIGNEFDFVENIEVQKSS
jgi:hypothetical protein